MGRPDDADRQSTSPWSELGKPAHITRREIREYHDSLQMLDLTIRGYESKATVRPPVHLKIVK